MQKTRFDDKEPSTRAAARPSRILAGMLFCAFIAAAGCMETSKAQGGREVTETQVFVRSPEGAVPPKGLELVEIGMSVSEVEVKLGKMYEINRAKRDEEENIEYPRQHEAQQVESRAHWDESTWRRKR